MIQSDVIICEQKKCCLTAMYLVMGEKESGYSNGVGYGTYVGTNTCATHLDRTKRETKEETNNEPTVERLVDLIEGYQQYLD
jgi:hypothetical protein